MQARYRIDDTDRRILRQASYSTKRSASSFGAGPKKGPVRGKYMDFSLTQVLGPFWTERLPIALAEPGRFS